MELKGISRSKHPLIGLEKPEITGFSEGNMLDTIGQERIDSLKKAIQEIKHLDEERWFNYQVKSYIVRLLQLTIRLN